MTGPCHPMTAGEANEFMRAMKKRAGSAKTCERRPQCLGGGVTVRVETSGRGDLRWYLAGKPATSPLVRHVLVNGMPRDWPSL